MSKKAENKPRSKRFDLEGSEPKEVRPGVWKSTVMLGYKANGDRNRRTVTARSAAECRRKIARLVRDHEQGRTVTVGGSMTLSAWMAHYFEKRELAEDLDAQTLQNYRSKIKNYVDEVRLGKISMSRLRPEDVERQYRSMRDAGLAISTVRQFHNILRKGLDMAVRRGVVGHNPVVLATVPKPLRGQNVSKQGESLTVAQAKSLLQVIRTVEQPARWYLGTLLGPRQSEVLGLAWDRVDLVARRLWVDRKLYRLRWEHGCQVAGGEALCGGKRGADCPARHGGGLFLGEPKSVSGFRGLPMPDVLYDALVAQRRLHDLWEVQDGVRSCWRDPGGVEVEFVFKQRNGRPPNARQDWAEFKELLRRAGISTGTVKDLRHTAATMLLVQKVDSRVVMEIMGWSQTSMLKRYQHVLDELQVDAIDKVADALLGSGEDSKPPTPPAGNVVGLDAWKQARGI